MTLLDTFYIQFASNSKQAQADVDALDKEIAKLATKGNNRTEAEKKQLSELRKHRLETTKDIKDQARAADGLGDSFSSIAESLGKMVIGFLGLDGLKGGIVGAEKFTAGLQMQSKWLGINAQQLAAFDEAMQTVGAAPGEGISAITALHDRFVEMGFGSSMPDFLKAMRTENEIYKKMVGEVGKDRARDQFEQLGLKQGLPPAAILFLMQEGNEVDDVIAQMAKLNGVTDESTEAARKFEAQWIKTKTSIQSSFIGANDATLPLLTSIMKYFNDRGGLTGAIDGWMGTDPDSDEFGTPAPKKDEFGASPPKKDEGEAEPPSGGSSSALGLRSNNPGNLQPGGREATYATPEAGLAAMADNLRRYGKKGWNSIEEIINHWSPAKGQGNSAAGTEAYKAALMTGTGFGRKQKLDLNDPAVLDSLIAAMVRQENGANPYSDSQIMQSIMLGKQALNSASQSPFNTSGGPGGGGSSKTISIKTGDINIQTQAANAQDIAGAISTSLRNQLRMTVGNIDDGVFA